MNSKQIEDIIQGCKKGKRNSQEMLYRHYSRKMFAVCMYYAGNKAEAEDFLHNGFIKVFEKIKQYKEKGVFEAWLRKVFMHTALEKYRNKKESFVAEQSEIVQQLENQEEDILSKITAVDLMNIIQKLSPAYRMVFNLYVLDGYSHREISSLLGIAEGTSKSNLSRARLILKEKVELNQQQQKVGLF